MKVKNGIWHLLKTAVLDFSRNKVRTFLTSLGITIGVLSVVMLIALGLGLKNYIQQRFESLGTNLIIVMPGQMLSGEISNMASGMVGGIKFDEKDVMNIKRVKNLQHVVAVFMKSTTIESGEKGKFGYIMGTNEEIFTILDLKPVKGVLLTKAEIQQGSKKVVLGNGLAKNLFDDPKLAVGKTIRANDQRFKVVGVLESVSDPEQNQSVFMSYKTTFGTINPDKTFYAIFLGVENKEDVEEVKKDVETVLLKRYKKDEFSVTEQTEILSAVDQIFGVINSVLVAIGSISLLVGGIGIMNIMYATVTERINEIGIRRAVGATKKDILFQFLAESTVLSVLGGLVGLLLAAIIVLLLRSFFPASINLLSVVVTLSISSAIGIFFGVFPARRAANLPPIEAIRYE